jgi:hypothetical protein
LQLYERSGSFTGLAGDLLARDVPDHPLGARAGDDGAQLRVQRATAEAIQKIAG